MSRIARLLAGDRVTLARAITAVENERAESRAILRGIHAHLGRARVIGVTGAPGVGKSTLLNALIRAFRRDGESVGVIAVDPTSPFSGGAILGDRIRMSEHGDDDGVFVRSLASRGHLGGLSRATARVVDVMDAAGLGTVIIETVGTGQSEVDIMHMAQTVLVVCAPGLGDEIQAIKAGVLEIADLLVVNKADRPGADAAAARLRDALALGDAAARPVPVLRTVATTGEGLADLVAGIAAHQAGLDPDARRGAARLRARALIAAAAAERLRRHMVDGVDADLDSLCDSVLRGDMALDVAAAEALRRAGAGDAL